MLRRLCTLCAIVFALTLILHGTVLAHAELILSQPEVGECLSAPPTVITLAFGEEIDPERSKFTVTSRAGSIVARGELDLNDLDRKTLTGTVKAGIGDGVYTVKWEALTPDEN